MPCQELGISTAQRCFTRNGFQATSMQDIFAEAGLSASAVYSHFTGKDEIITAIAEDVIDKITSTVDAAPPVASRPPSTRRLTASSPRCSRQTSRRSRSSSGGKPSAIPRSASGYLPSTAARQTTSPSSSASARRAAPSILAPPPDTPRRS
jgi:hypothetical protein